MDIPSNVQLKGIKPSLYDILTPEALQFLANLHRRFDQRRHQLLLARSELQERLNSGEILDFPSDLADVLRTDWTISSIPKDLEDRRVEITGPVDRKMVINALNSGAKVFMACFEDACAPWISNLIDGQRNIRDAIQGTITFEDPVSKKSYRLKDETTVLKVRPRGWHLEEKHLLVDGVPVSGSLFDFGLTFFHNAQALLDKGSGPYFYLPKLEHHLEAELWNDVFVYAQEAFHIPQNTIKATVLIETLPGAFHAESILYQLRNHIDGLNCGRWDYIFSYIKKHQKDKSKILPQRSAVTMTVPFMRAYCLHVIQSCHRRGAHAMGGMAAQIPVKNNPQANAEAFEKVKEDKQREVQDGHDGTWVAHPALVPIAMEVFDTAMPTPHQIHRQRHETITPQDLLDPCTGPRTLEQLQLNAQIGTDYIAAWLGGLGAVPLNNLMEDTATAEISRIQIWQWLKNHTFLDDGQPVDYTLLKEVFKKVQQTVENRGDTGIFTVENSRNALQLMQELVFDDTLSDFLTTLAYDRYLAP